MSRDWHATYLTDPRAMDAAAARATRTGEDGWAAAYTLALTLPPAPGSYDAVGARDVLVPESLPDADELARLEVAAPEDDDEGGGYYQEPNIDYGNHDMPASMVRRARPGETVRPDLRCPKCCQAAECEEETGMPGQVYRCTECRESWEYRSVDTDVSCPCGQCGPPPGMSYLAVVPPRMRANMAAFMGRWAPRGGWTPLQMAEASGLLGPVPVGLDEESEWAWPPADVARERERVTSETARRQVAEAFDVPPAMLGEDGRVTGPIAHHTATAPDSAPVLVAGRAREGRGTRGAWFFEDEVVAWLRQVPGTPESDMLVARQELAGEWTATEREADDLRTALEFASRCPTIRDADQHAGMREARRRGLVMERSPGRWRRGEPARVYLTARGRVELRRLCRPQPSR